ncbi:M48 family metallopeptidase [Neogemmobacter tilapiae]|uniref:Peptidase M48 n=1 Tax=Neogemmobacter tilapiae TaxID=875041 RepID=A0A918WGK8_9RHOB|nr:M48 family metallopeptidase [Gemmobacter tilapiae]GHC44718.1 peptidase M48 [Gemmobacter tilapiae]
MLWLILTLVATVAIALVTHPMKVAATLQHLKDNSRRMDDPDLMARVQLLAEAMDIAAIPVRIYEVDPINALAAPDGQVYITRGFMQAYRSGKVSADELAGVVAHELGHVALGHGRKRMIDMTGQSALFMVLQVVLLRFVPFVGFWIAGILTQAIGAHLSRKAEHEADAYATALMLKSGIGTEAQKSMFRKLGSLTGNARPPAWAASHPAPETRIAEVDARERRWGIKA